MTKTRAIGNPPEAVEPSNGRAETSVAVPDSYSGGSVMRFLGSKACIAPVAAVMLLAFLSGCGPYKSRDARSVNPIAPDTWEHLFKYRSINPAILLSGEFSDEEHEHYKSVYEKDLEIAAGGLPYHYQYQLEKIENDKELFYKILKDNEFICAYYSENVVCKRVLSFWDPRYYRGKEMGSDIEKARSREFVLQFLVENNNKISNLKAYVFDLGIRDGRLSP